MLTIRKKINIDTFNLFALLISFLTHEIKSAGFIVLMLLFASLLDWYTESRTEDAVKQLLLLKPEINRPQAPNLLPFYEDLY